MKETLPTVDMSGSGGFQPDDSERAKTVMADTGGQRVTPRSPLPPVEGGPPPWSPVPAPPPPSAPPPPPPAAPFQPAPAPAAGGRTVVMGVPAPQIPLAWVGIVSGPGGERGRTFVLRPETVLGRSAGEVILSGDSTISAQHTKIRLEPKEGGAEDEQVFMLYDLASANGTFVGTRENYRDEKSRAYRCELKPGDYILIGETTLVFLRA